MEQNLAAVLLRQGEIVMKEIPVPTVDSNDVLLRMAQVGICGSDVHYYTSGRIGDFIVKQPMVLGHEGAGVVVKCGSNVKHLKPGDRVAIEPGVPCRMCNYCKSGRYNLCLDIAFCATPPFDGNLCRYYKHAADFCYKLPSHISLEEGALLEPLSVGVHACQRANVSLGSRVLICGAGPIGLVALLAAKAMGADQVCITDVIDHRLESAKKLGADCTVNVKNQATDDLVKQITQQMGGQMPNITIECSGFETSVRLGIFGIGVKPWYELTAPADLLSSGQFKHQPHITSLTVRATESGGTIVLVGLGPSEIKIPIVNAAVREVDIRGVFRYANCYPIALNLIASGKVDVKPLITHRFTLDESVKVFEAAQTGIENAIKIMIAC